MKQSHHTTPAERETTFLEVWRWAQELARLHARIAPRFARPEPRRRALKYLQGILSTIERKNSWQLAEQAGEARPDGMQRLLSSTVWDADGVRDDLRTYAIEQLGCESAILVMDESGFPKRGDQSAGVGLQHCGTTGEVENCQVGVFLSYVTAKGHTLIDRELYLPLDWCNDRDRCRAAGIPVSRRFQTKPELAVQMIERIRKTAVPICWVVADTVYGDNERLREWLEAQHYPYVLAVPCNEPVEFQTPAGRRREKAELVEAVVLGDQDWQRLSMSEGTKGPRLFDWACIPRLQRCEDDGQHWLLIRRSLTKPQKKQYYFVFAPPGTTLSEMVKAIGARWRIEEDARKHQRSRPGSLRGEELHWMVPARHAGDVGSCLPCRTMCHSWSLCFSSCGVPTYCSHTTFCACPHHSGSAPSARAAHLALSLSGETCADLVLVASLSPKSRQLLPHQTSSRGWLILACSPLLSPQPTSPSCLVPDFLDESEKSGKIPGSPGSLGIWPRRVLPIV